MPEHVSSEMVMIDMSKSYISCMMFNIMNFKHKVSIPTNSWEKIKTTPNLHMCSVKIVIYHKNMQNNSNYTCTNSLVVGPKYDPIMYVER